ncbi:site-specific integrase [Corticibacterium sp. UT-5YL-CI-8]|nr:site-specific integrase [Tianweitania sp. UT-5YL-CI-8]
MPLKLRKRGQVYWIRGTHLKQYVYRSTGATELEVAEAILAKEIASITSDKIYGPKATRTFGQAVKSYIQADGDTRFLGVHKDRPPSGLYKEFENTQLKNIQQNDLDEVARKLYPNAQPETRNRQCYTPFVAVWNHAVRNGWADVRQWARPKKPKGTNVVRLAKRRVGTFPVEYEHAAKFVAAMSPAPAMLLTALFYTGMRPIEIFALEAKDVNLKGRWITLSNTKTGEPRGIPIHSFLVPLFESLLKRNSLAEDGRLFRTPRGNPYEAIVSDEEGTGGGGLKTAIQGARRRSKIMDIAPYTGRHSCSTGLVVAGVHPHIKDQILGHAANDMSRHYTNVPQAPLIEAIDKLPVPALWLSLPWWEDPLAQSGKLAEGTGKRTDLERKKDAG